MLEIFGVTFGVSLATKSLSSSSGNSEYLVRCKGVLGLLSEGEYSKTWSKPENAGGIPIQKVIEDKIIVKQSQFQKEIEQIAWSHAI